MSLERPSYDDVFNARFRLRFCSCWTTQTVVATEKSLLPTPKKWQCKSRFFFDFFGTSITDDIDIAPNTYFVTWPHRKDTTLSQTATQATRCMETIRNVVIIAMKCTRGVPTGPPTWWLLKHSECVPKWSTIGTLVSPHGRSQRHHTHDKDHDTVHDLSFVLTRQMFASDPHTWTTNTPCGPLR